MSSQNLHREKQVATQTWNTLEQVWDEPWLTENYHQTVLIIDHVKPQPLQKDVTFSQWDKSWWCIFTINEEEEEPAKSVFNISKEKFLPFEMTRFPLE